MSEKVKRGKKSRGGQLRSELHSNSTDLFIDGNLGGYFEVGVKSRVATVIKIMRTSAIVAV